MHRIRKFSAHLLFLALMPPSAQEHLTDHHHNFPALDSPLPYTDPISNSDRMLELCHHPKNLYTFPKDTCFHLDCLPAYALLLPSAVLLGHSWYLVHILPDKAPNSIQMQTQEASEAVLLGQIIRKHLVNHYLLT